MKTILLLAVAVCATATCAFADDAKKAGAARVFKNMDTNADGSLSLDEYKAGTVGQIDRARVEDMFKKKDKNADGKLDLEELQFVPPKPKPEVKPEPKAEAKTEKAKE